ncbi:DUF2285 domain-containing protein [Paracoccus sp. P2]|uniref:DUF2285 domain-containing protein n=1 Tax=Paracoccus sp. P2 TaxID=3248840 RepID=UPI00391F007E
MVLTEAPSGLGGSIDDAPPTWRLDFSVKNPGMEFRFPLGNGQHLQVLDGALKGDAIAVAVVPLSLAGFDRIEAVQRFLSALHGRAIPPDTRLTRQQRERLRRMLRAFDGHRAGTTQQEIARVLLNTGRLDRDEWQASSARHAIKALLRDARSMVAGGYRKLLRHRRPR